MYLLTSYFFIPISYDGKGIFVFGVSSRRCCIELVNFSIFGISGWGIDLSYSEVQWFALETNWDHSVVFEVTPKYCISDSFADHEG